MDQPDDKLHEAAEDLADRWHDGDGKGKTLAEYLGLDAGQYDRWVADGSLPEGYVLPEHPIDEQPVPSLADIAEARVFVLLAAVLVVTMLVATVAWLVTGGR